MTDKYVDIPEPLKGFDSEKTEKLLKKIHLNIRCDMQNLMFKEFWNLCENPIPTIFNKGKHIYITRDANKISEVKEMKDVEEMKFVDLTTIPIKHGGRQSKDWLSILLKIPIGKAWTPKVKGVQTIREAVNKLVKEKKIVDGEFEVMQRTTETVLTVYVAHNKLK